MANDTDKIPEDIRKLSFEDALARLEAIVNSLESGDVKLDDSIAMYTEGNHLKQHCQAKLKAAEEKIEKIRLSEGGQIEGVEAFDPEGH